MLADPEYEPYLRPFVDAVDPKALAAAKRSAIKAIDSDATDLPDGVWMHFYEKRKNELRSMGASAMSSADARADRVLRIRDSSGRAKARKF